MGDGYKEESEFGGNGEKPFPAERGYVKKQWEVLQDMYATNPSDANSGADIVTQRAK